MHDDLAERLAAAGFVAAEEEAAELRSAAGGDASRLDALVARRLTGEPLEWIVGSTELCGLRLRVDPGVYVPRWHSEAVAWRARDALPERGVAVDLCTGCGALAAVLRHARPGARVVATDVDPRAVACARANGVEAYAGDLYEPLPPELRGRVDVVCGVVPFVPHDELHLLQRDTFAFETPLAYDGGPDGTALLRRALDGARAWLHERGTLVLALGDGQPEALDLPGAEILRDEDGDVRGIAWRPI